MRPVLTYWAPLVFFAGLVLYLSIVPSVGGPEYMWDKANHFAAYVVLSLLFTRVITMGQRVTLGRAIAALVIVTLFGIMVEFLQSLTQTRSAEALDALANGLGASVGITAYSLFKNRAEVKGCL